MYEVAGSESSIDLSKRRGFADGRIERHTAGVQVTGGTACWFAFQCNKGNVHVYDSGTGSGGAHRTYSYDSFADPAGSTANPSWIVNVRSTCVKS